MLTKEELDLIYGLLESYWFREAEDDHRNTDRLNKISTLQERIEQHIKEVFPETLQAQVKELENYVLTHSVVTEE